jgi:hypothetical protein
MRDLSFGGRVSAIDRRDLVGMNRQASNETVAPGAAAIPLEAMGIAKIRINRVDGRDLGGGCSEQGVRPLSLARTNSRSESPGTNKRERNLMTLSAMRPTRRDDLRPRRPGGCEVSAPLQFALPILPGAPLRQISLEVAPSDLIPLVAKKGADESRRDQDPGVGGIDRAQSAQDRRAGQRHPGRKLRRARHCHLPIGQRREPSGDRKILEPQPCAPVIMGPPAGDG